MSSQNQTQSRIRAGLEALARGETVDWKRHHIPAALLAETIRAASVSEERPAALTVLNAVVDGDLLLDGLGDIGFPIRLQILRSELRGGFRSRNSHWRGLVIAETKAQYIDLPRCTVDADVVIEKVECDRWLELRGCEIAGHVSLKSSRFTAAERLAAIQVSGTVIRLGLDASDVRTCGEFRADRLNVNGDLSLEAAQLDASNAESAVALNLNGSRVSGQVRLCQGSAGRFSAKGRVQIASATFGSITLKAATLDGLGEPALVGDEVSIEDTIDLSGLSAEGGAPFEAAGALRFGSCRVGRQVQIFDALVTAAEFAIVFHGAKIGGDLLVGHETAKTKIDGGLSANVASIEGRLLFSMLEIASAATSIAVRQAKIGQEISVYHVEAQGAVRFDNTSADGISVEATRITRRVPVQRAEGTPEYYAHPADALLDASFAKLESDLRIERVRIEGGDIRLIGARIGAGAQLSMIDITPDAGNAIIAQAAIIDGGFQIAGSPDSYSKIHGDVNLIGTNIRGDLTFVHAEIGSVNRNATIILRSASVGTSATLLHSRLFGSFSAGGASFGGDLHFHSSTMLNPNAVACDLRGIQVAGKLQWATATEAEPVNCELEGLVTADAATVGILAWHRIRLRERTQLDFTNISVIRQIEADELIASDNCRLDLSGTTTPLLLDKLGNERDSWGAGKIGLGLDNFGYQRLAAPSGQEGDDPAEIRSWRLKWLDRRFDCRSARPARHLATVLRAQGLFEASRLVLISAFASEGWAKPTAGGRLIATVFGWLFGHGLSGSRAFLSLVMLWLVGATGVLYLEQRDLLVLSGTPPGVVRQSCSKELDPLLFSADLMIPLVDLGQDKRCEVGRGPRATPAVGYAAGVNDRTIFGELELFRFLAVLFQVVGWTFVSLAIATWSGLFRRGGRE